VFDYFADEGVHGVGQSLAQFAVLPQRLDGRAPIRFTSKMLPHLERGELLKADGNPAAQVAAASPAWSNPPTTTAPPSIWPRESCWCSTSGATRTGACRWDKARPPFRRTSGAC
jgi:hypothetical protein